MTTALLGTVGQERAGKASAVLNTARQSADAIDVAAFGALAGHAESAAGSAQIVDAVRWSAGISVALLIGAALTARLVRNVTPDAAAREKARPCAPPNPDDPDLPDSPDFATPIVPADPKNGEPRL